jgi:hypothetical protein
MSRLLIWRYKGLKVGEVDTPETSFEGVTIEPPVGHASNEFLHGIRQNAA